MPLYVQKRIKIDGVPRRALDLVGQINVVWFSSQDIDLLGGAPALRRRYLDATLSQVDSRYLRALQSYSKVLVQRNNLLRLIREGRARTEELAFWDGELVREGSYLIEQRQGALSALTPQIASTHSRLSGQPPLEIKYLPSVPPGGGPVEQAFRGQLAASLSREVAQGMTLVGPHRDELRFLLQGIDMGLYGSRGEQRTVALSLKLAEALFLKETTGEEPILLLDDVLSELDRERRRHLLETASTYQQVLLTTTDLDRIEPPFLEQATRFWVRGGGVEPG
jgi:DNA replication and repair protein RecF